MNTLGKRLAEERERLGLNQTDFAAAGGVKRASQANYEADKRSPDASYLQAISRIGVDLQYVLLERRCDTAVREKPGEYRVRPEYQEVIRLWRDVPERTRPHLLAIMQEMVPRIDIELEPPVFVDPDKR